MTTRDRRQARVDRLREWSEKHAENAEAADARARITAELARLAPTIPRPLTGGHYDLTATARAQALRTAARHAHYLATYAERFNTLPRHTPEFRTRAREAVK